MPFMDLADQEVLATIWKIVHCRKGVMRQYHIDPPFLEYIAEIVSDSDSNPDDALKGIACKSSCIPPNFMECRSR